VRVAGTKAGQILGREELFLLVGPCVGDDGAKGQRGSLFPLILKHMLPQFERIIKLRDAARRISVETSATIAVRPVRNGFAEKRSDNPAYFTRETTMPCWKDAFYSAREFFPKEKERRNGHCQRQPKYRIPELHAVSSSKGQISFFQKKDEG
jgi:hypothetical protein